MKLSTLAAVVILIVGRLGNGNAANLITNGSFESPDITSASYINFGAGNEPAGFEWKVATGNIDLAGPNPYVLFPPYDGIQAVDLNGLIRGSMYQDFTTTLGQLYELSFAYADNPLEGGDSSAEAKVTDLNSNGILLSTSVSHSTSTNSPVNGDWKTFSGTFSGSGGNVRLLFTSTSSSNGPSGGIILDDVRVLPASSMGLPGDYNQNGVVDVADYVVWRKDPANFGGDPAGYNTWRANFGMTAGNGSGAVSNISVPEPMAAHLLLLGLLAVGSCRYLPCATKSAGHWVD